MEIKRYSNYKDSEIEWIGKIPNTWNNSKIKFHFKNSKKKTNDKNPTILSLTMQGIKIRDITTNEGQIASSYDNYTKVDIGDIVMNPMDLISGFVDCSKVEGVISPAYYTLKTINNENTDYYNYYLQKHYYEQIFFPFAEGVSTDYRWTLKNEDLMNFPIIEPPINEQEQIAKYLDNKKQNIEQNITKNKKLITLLKEKRTTLINQTVTKGLNPDTPMKESGIPWIGKIPRDWEIKTFKNVNLFNPSVNINSLDENSTITYTPMENIKKGEFINNSAKLKDIPNNLTRYEEGDIVLAKVTPCFENGNLAIMDNLYSGHGFGSSELFVIRPEEIFKKFIFYWLQSETFIQKACSTMHGVAGLQRIDANFVRNSKVPYPDLIEQEEISNYLDKKTQIIDKTIEKIEKNIELLEEYKESLIHHVVTGKIDVRGVEL